MSMKCVRVETTILRLPIDKAQKLVTAGKGTFVCKGIWRAWRKSLSEKNEGKHGEV